jgi:hypothetical protein
MTDTTSPVEECHIDYILEEEFCVRSEFSTFEQGSASLGG